MQQTYSTLFETLPDSSKVWVYHSQVAIPTEMQADIQERLDEFIMEWAAHGEKLYGGATLIDDYFIVIAVDEKQTIASGCSIDSSIHFLKRLGQEFKLNFLDRLNVVIEENDTKKIVHYSDIINHPGAIFYNPVLSTLGEFRKGWMKEI